MATYLGTAGNDSLSAGKTNSFENDFLDGQAGNDSLYAGKGDDTLRGGAGDDSLDGDAGNDLAVFSGSFAAYSISYDSSIGAYLLKDSVAGRDGTDAVIGVEFFQFADGIRPASQIFVGAGGGTAGNDSLNGTMGNDLLQGLDGSDTLDGGAGSDTLEGGADSDLVNGGAGNDTVDGGPGQDTAMFSAATAAITASLVSGVATGEGTDILIRIESLSGGAFGDVLTGDAGNNILAGLGGNDTLHGGDGFDQLAGGLGDDFLDGGASVDRADYSSAAGAIDADLARGTGLGQGTDVFNSIEDILGSQFADKLAGGGDDDFLQGIGGNDLVLGRGGNDTLYGGKGSDTLVGGAGNDFLQSESGSAVAVFSGTRAQYIITGSGADYVVADTVADRDGTDDVSNLHALQFTDQTVTLTGTAPAPVPPAPPPSPGFTSGNDLITGTGGSDSLHGGKGGDTLNGGSGNDVLYGDQDNDVLNGGDGNDTLDGGTGSDVLNGGNGLDTASYSSAQAVIVTLLSTAPQNTVGGEIDTLSSIENLTGGFFDDRLTGNALVNVLSGSDGNDSLDGGAGADQLIGGAGDDIFMVDNTGDAVVELSNQGTDNVMASVSYTLSAQVENLTLGASSTALNGIGNGLANLITGNFFGNVLDGGGGDDVLSGDAGNDVLRGSAGNDTLDGAEGRDAASYLSLRSHYAWIATAAGWTVADLQGSDGTDILTRIERLNFSDISVALDLDGNAGVVARLLGAVFGAAAVNNRGFVGAGLRLLDGGTSVEALTSMALDLVLGSGHSNAAVVDLLFTNLVGFAPSAEVEASFVAWIVEGTFNPVTLAMYAANLDLNAANIDLAGVAVSGLEFN